MQTDPQSEVAPPVARLAGPVALWGGGAGLIAIAAGSARGVGGSAALGAACAVAAALVAIVLLASLKPRAMGRWALPLLLAQMTRTLLAPMIGLAVFLPLGPDPLAFWLSLLAVAVLMLAGETIVVSRMLGGRRLQEAAA